MGKNAKTIALLEKGVIAIMGAIAIVHVAGAIYAYHQGFSYYDYRLFDGVRFFWNSQATPYLGKLGAILLAIYEAGWIAFISPLIVLKAWYNISVLQTEIGLATIISVWLILIRLSEKLSERRSKYKKTMVLKTSLQMLKDSSIIDTGEISETLGLSELKVRKILLRAQRKGTVPFEAKIT